MIDNNKETDIIDKILVNNTANYNYSKLIEELFELGEVCSKILNKKPKYAPPIERLVEELGDVFLRAYIISRQENIKELVEDRIANKLLQLDNYIKQNKYKGGL